jgi:hypothetical protein
MDAAMAVQFCRIAKPTLYVEAVEELRYTVGDELVIFGNQRPLSVGIGQPELQR